MHFSIGPLGLFLLVLGALIVVKVLGKHARLAGALLLGVMACGAVLVTLYFFCVQVPGVTSVVEVSQSRVVAGQTVVYREVDLPVEPERAAAIPVESALASEQAAREPRPAWVDEGKKLDGNDYFVTVMVGPHASRELCEDAMTEELRRAVDRYIDQLIGSEQAAELVQLPLADVRRQIVQAEYQETVQASFGPMVNLYALLKFDKKMQDRIVIEHEQALVQRRVGVLAGGMGLILVVLGTSFGYLKLDTATRGYYSGRLKLAAAAVILSAVAASAMVARKAGVDIGLVGQRSAPATENRF